MKLIFNSPDVQAQDCAVAEGTTKVGRAPNNDIVIQNSSVSSHHCDILVHGTEVIVCDHGSANGTWVAGKPVAEQSPVRNGETIRFGSVEAMLKFPEELAQEPDSATELTAVWSLKTLKEAGQQATTPAQVTVAAAQGAEVVEQTMVMPALAQQLRERSQPQVVAPARSAPWKTILWIAAAGLLFVGAYVWWRLRQTR